MGGGYFLPTLGPSVEASVVVNAPATINFNPIGWAVNVETGATDFTYGVRVVCADLTP
jgi:hypothetical protein